jgi:hypothetical protein
MINVWMLNGIKIDRAMISAEDLLAKMQEKGERGMTFVTVTDSRGFVHHLRVREISNVMELKD